MPLIRRRRHIGRRRFKIRSPMTPFARPVYSNRTRWSTNREGNKNRNLQRLSYLLGGGETSNQLAVPNKYDQLDLKIQKNPFQQYMYADLKYVQNEVLASPGGGIGTIGGVISYSLNDLYNPRISGGGHQPYSFDQITAVYRSFRVFQVSVEIEFVNPTSPTIAAFIQTQTSGDTYSMYGQTYLTTAEKPGMWHKLAIPTSGNTNYCRFHAVYNIWDIEGMSYREWIGDDKYTGLNNASPAFLPKITVGIADLSAPVGTQTVYASINLVYHARFYDRITAAQS